VPKLPDPAVPITSFGGWGSAIGIKRLLANDEFTASVQQRSEM